MVISSIFQLRQPHHITPPIFWCLRLKRYLRRWGPPRSEFAGVNWALILNSTQTKPSKVLDLLGFVCSCHWVQFREYLGGWDYLSNPPGFVCQERTLPLSTPTLRSHLLRVGHSTGVQWGRAYRLGKGATSGHSNLWVATSSNSQAVDKEPRQRPWNGRKEHQKRPRIDLGLIQALGSSYCLRGKAVEYRGLLRSLSLIHSSCTVTDWSNN